MSLLQLYVKRKMLKEKITRYKQLHVNDWETDYKHHNGIDVNDWLKRKLMATNQSNIGAKVVFKMFVLAAPFTKFPPTNWIIKKVAKLGDTYNTKGYSIPLYIDTTVRSINKSIDLEDKMIIPPINIVKEAIIKSEYRAIMNYCICRDMDQCKDYPQDLGCVFLGRAAETCVKNGIAHEATVAECLAHIDRATAAGLSAGAYFIEFEQYAWGFPDADIPDYIAFCFCCPCCCHSIKFENLSGGELKHITHQSIGWHAEIIPEKCQSCGECVKNCPRHYISIENGKPEIYEACAGCGQCSLKCKNQAIHVVQHGRTKEHLEDYFDKLHAKW